MKWDYRCENGHIFTVQGSVESFCPQRVCPECSLTGERYYSGQVIAVHGGPTTSADAKVDPWRSAGAQR